MFPEDYIKKTDIVAAIRAKRPNLSGRQVWRAVDMIIDQMCKYISNQNYIENAPGGRDVMIKGFGGFWVNTSLQPPMEIHSINLEDGIITLPARVRYLIYFFPDKPFRDAVQNIP